MQLELDTTAVTPQCVICRGWCFTNVFTITTDVGQLHPVCAVCFAEHYSSYKEDDPDDDKNRGILEGG